ncbi:carbohydrate ABC transporter permease [Opitutus terrae]|uniref:Binding-protein-dependent transport systems inner membrane component n=1 Tax=Opitutus terrae (strain DSM 11246 / JCM 15787 / PB90-1) TaxID=452637 RepID=B2A087_OPITP|nr:sugar ABC transporter permease [Opitutus terrae]ACB77423.1 binding-protein-dependent transport systems inner membrane component [Opitutus terrae PB90-1]
MIAWKQSQRRAAPWFLLPALALLGVFVVWPLLRALGWSFTNADLLAVERATWVGAGNYSDLLTDPRFRQAFANTALFAVMVVPVQTALAFALALWVNRPEPAWRWLRTAFFVPVIVAMPVLAVLWTMLYQPTQGDQTGLINAALGWLGVPPQAWLRDPALALPALAFMSVWQGVGLQMLVFVAGLQQVPRELLDAARIDGAGGWQRLVHVVLPSVRNTVVFVVTVTTILAFRIFVQPYLMTRGGPGNRTVSIIQSIYEMTFLDQDLGHACAAALLFLLLVAALTLLQRRWLKEDRG